MFRAAFQRAVFVVLVFACLGCVRSLAEEASKPKAAELIKSAETFFQKGDFAAAEKEWSTALELTGLTDRQIWNARFGVARSRMARKDYTAARHAFEKLALADDAPESVRGEALLNVGHTLWREQKFAEAADLFEKVSKRDDLSRFHCWEAADRARAMRRLAQGLSARDPEASRTKSPKLPKPSVVLYVATDGELDDPGTEEKPLGSLSQAVEKIRQLRRDNKIGPGGVQVLVRGGEYPVTESLKLTEADSGTAEAPVVLRAYPGEKPVFTGGVTLKGFKPVDDPEILRRLPEESRGKVVQVDLKKLGISQLPPMGRRGYGCTGPDAKPWVELYVDGKPQTLARWPNDGFVKIGKVHQAELKNWRQPPSGEAGIFEYQNEDSRQSRWTEADDAWLFGYWAYLWAIDSRKIDRIDPVKKRIEMEPCSGYDYKKGNPYYVFNLLEEIDAPGEWYLNRKTGTLYFYPPERFDESKARLSTLAGPFIETLGTSHLRVEGLTFEMGCGNGAEVGDGESVLLIGCTLRRLGNWGVSIQGGKRHGVHSCDLAILGGGGVFLIGGNKAKLIPAGHFVENCHIHDFTRVDRSYAPAIDIDGVGNRLVHNLIHDSPHHGIRLEGYEQLVELNEVCDVVQESDDQSGIDMWGNPALRGNVIRYNFWHHNGGDHLPCGQAGIRLDDMISAVEMYGNIFWDTARGHFGGIQIHGGKENVAANNLFVDCASAFSFTPWGKKRWLKNLHQGHFHNLMISDGVKPTDPPHVTKYPDLADLEGKIDHNYVWRNVTLDCPKFALREKGQNELFENVSLAKDPGFVAAATGDFTLPSDSVLYDQLGFSPIPFDEIGLYKSENRAELPSKKVWGKK
jgi:tetratricopeptide (TPR) repeat protein